MLIHSYIDFQHKLKFCFCTCNLKVLEKYLFNLDGYPFSLFIGYLQYTFIALLIINLY